MRAPFRFEDLDYCYTTLGLIIAEATVLRGDTFYVLDLRLNCVLQSGRLGFYFLYSECYGILSIIKEEKSGLIILVHSAYRLRNR